MYRIVKKRVLNPTVTLMEVEAPAGVLHYQILNIQKA